MKNFDYWFIFRKSHLLLNNAFEELRILRGNDIKTHGIYISESLFAGTLNGRSCFAGVASENYMPGQGLSFHSLRRLFGILPDDKFHLAGSALQLINWNEISRFCGKCGVPMKLSDKRLTKTCSSCRQVSYPVISPAVIVAITRENRILLAQPTRIKNALYSVIAGYLEIGENLEDAARREIREEVGIEIKNLRYFGSQSWPFSGSLMAAFTAEYASGNIVIDKSEIEAAGWFTAEDLPPFPSKGSISHRLITRFVKGI